MKKIKFENLYINYIEKDNCISKTLALGNVWEPWMQIFIKHFYVENTDMIDIGANIGANTFQQLLKYKSTANKIYMFEPYFGEVIQKTIDENNLNNHIVLYKYALSDSNKVLDLPFVDLNAEQNFGGYNINNVLTVQSNDNYNCYKLDHFNLKNISLIKIDVENHELLTLYGMKETLIHNKPTILLEIWSKSRGWIYPEMQNDSTFCQKVLLNYIDVTHFLESLNYITYHIFGDEYLFVHKSNLKLLADFLSNL